MKTWENCIIAANINITGTDMAAFIRTTTPVSSIQAGGQTSFNIKFEPVKQGEHNASLVIPTNDSSRNPVSVNLKGGGVQGYPVVRLSQGTTAITNNSLTPFDFGQVALGSNNELTFTIRNVGNIRLELTGTPVIESSNIVFSVITQPAITSLNPAATTTFIIRYTPSVEGDINGSITIKNNSDEGQFIINVKGKGVTP